MNPIASVVLDKHMNLEIPEIPYAYDSRLAEKFVLRLPPNMRELYASIAKLEGRSMNSMFVFALRQYVEGLGAKAANAAVEQQLADVLNTLADLQRSMTRLEAVQ